MKYLFTISLACAIIVGSMGLTPSVSAQTGEPDSSSSDDSHQDKSSEASSEETKSSEGRPSTSESSAASFASSTASSRASSIGRSSAAASSLKSFASSAVKSSSKISSSAAASSVITGTRSSEMFSSVTSSEASSTVSLTLTGSSFFARENFWYSVPVIDPSVIIRMSELSLSMSALGGNLLLSLLFALIAGLSGLLFGRLQQSHGARLRIVLQRIPFQAAFTALIIWLFHVLVPSAGAQGLMGSAPAEFLRIPLYAFLFFLVVGTSNTLFNSMLITQGDRLHDMFVRPFTGSEGSDLRRKSWFIVLLILLYGVIGGYINPEFNFLPTHEIGIVIVTTLSIILSAYLKDIFLFFLARKWRFPSWFQANVGGLMIAVACVVLSRTFALNPGYIYGIPVGLLIGAALDRDREGLFDFLGILWMLVLALIAWGIGPSLAVYPVLFDLSNLLFVLLIEGIFIELLPFPQLPGGSIFKWKQFLWFTQFTVAAFLLFHTLFNPQGTILGLEQSPPAFIAALLLGCYSIGILVLWGCVVWVKNKE